MWKGKYRSTDSTKYGREKGKFTENWRYILRKGTQTYSEYFDSHRCLFQSEESKLCAYMAKMASLESFWKVPLGGCKRGRWGEEEGKLNGNYLRLIVGQNELIGNFKMEAGDAFPLPYFVIENRLEWRKLLRRLKLIRRREKRYLVFKLDISFSF
jgi:hypothetical protein